MYTINAAAVYEDNLLAGTCATVFEKKVNFLNILKEN